MDIMQAIEKDIRPVEEINFEPGDTVRPLQDHRRCQREDQVYEGVIAMTIKGKTNLHRKLSFDVGVEIFPISPKIQKIEVVRKSVVRRANFTSSGTKG